MKRLRFSLQTLCVLEQFAEEPSVWRYGYEIARETGLKSGTLYPILRRLAKGGALETKWIVPERGVPARHSCRLTSKGIEVLREMRIRVPR